jgi:1,4-dihydroxy-2-naphthoyl-CoA hydrolase
MPFVGLLGTQVLEANESRVTARLAWDESRCTTDGAMHGGALMALADTTGGICAFMNLPDGAVGTTTIESKTIFLRGVRAGHVDAISTPLHAGRTTIVVETDLFDADGRRVAKVLQSQAVLRPS